MAVFAHSSIGTDTSCSTLHAIRGCKWIHTWSILDTVVVSNQIALITHHNFCLQLVWVLNEGVLAGGSRHIVHLQVGVLRVGGEQVLDEGRLACSNIIIILSSFWASTSTRINRVASGQLCTWLVCFEVELMGSQTD